MKIVFQLSFLSLLFLSSCSFYNYTYIQTPVSVPELAKRGDLKVQANANFKEGSAEIAYSPINHIGLTASVSTGLYKQTNGWEAGLGYYLAKNEYLFSMYGGVGYGNVVNKGGWKEWFGIDSRQWNGQSDYNKYYLQASFGRNLWKVCRLSLALRASYATFNSYAYTFHYKNYNHTRNNGDQDYTYLESEQFDTLKISNASVLIIDPVVNATFFHTRRFSLIVQAGFTFIHAYGQFRDPHTIDLSGYQPTVSDDGKHTSTASKAPDRNHPIVFPITFSIGGRLNISTRRNKKS